MRFTRKLTLLAMLAIAATALAAPTAFAQTEPMAHVQTPRLIVQQEIHAANDVNCPAVTPNPPPTPPPMVAAGGCRVHVVSSGGITIGTHDSAGIEMSIGLCDIEFDLRVDSAGEGFATHHELAGGPACPRKACGQVTPPASEGRIWSIYMQETEPAPRERFVFLFCSEPTPSGPAMHCELALPITQPTTHRYTFTAADINGHGAGFPRCELTGVFNIEATPGLSGENLAEQNIEIRHT
jgi:hypothetical protein